jgi:hypothetical protein
MGRFGQCSVGIHEYATVTTMHEMALTFPHLKIYFFIFHHLQKNGST